MADLTKVVIACCAKVSFIHSNNALMFCHNTALYVFSEINYLRLCLCLCLCLCLYLCLCLCLCPNTLLCNVVYTGGSSFTVTHAKQQSQFNIPPYTSSAYTHTESYNDNFGLFCCPLALYLVSSATGASGIKKFRYLSGSGKRDSICLVVLE